MKAIVVGCGRVGSSVAKKLRKVGWEVVAIDENEEALARLGEQTEVGTNDSENAAPSAAKRSMCGVSRKGNLEPGPTTPAARSSTTITKMLGRSPR